ncbi:catecholate siderophore receptor Fiu [Asticcacaulis taihuensis]|uniref:Catecholate siderophore receptor n=1 Tax=Asticcacaulis taihuensis TaxID=260084 RepID=A0A1G4T5Y3_9CAUL|nr:catecholate siderophore receptor Fiu [Asticcacaulis taihuensis]SCW76701.1 catecholate siderophore receptor [Asticcacaulis taihuensis]
MSSIRNRKHAVNPYALALTALALPGVALADAAADAARDSTHVIVRGERHGPYKEDHSSSKKATADLIDTPQTIQVIGKEIIREQGATTLTEALRNSAGVGTFYLGENGSTSTGDAVYMRGSDASGSIFVDGVRDVASVSRDVFNIESVEVLKGAAGTDVGRGSATGAINLYTKHAAPHDFASASVSAGGGDFSRATADANWKLAETSALRLNLMAQDAGIAGRDAIKNKRWGAAASLGFGLGTSTRYFLDVMHVDQDNTPDGGVSTIGLPGYSAPDDRDFLNDAAPVNPKNFYGTKDDFDDIQTDVVTFSIEHDFNNGLHLSNLTRWSQTDQDYQLTAIMGQAATSTRPLLTPDPADPSTWTLTRLVNNKDVRNTMLTNQTNLQAHFRTAGLEHSLSTGLELISEEQKSLAFDSTTAGAYPAVSVYTPDANVSGYTRKHSGAYSDGQTDTIGLYVNDTIRFSEAWQVSAGLRLDHYKTDYKSVAVDGTVTAYKAEDDLLTGKFGLVYKPATNGSIYASYAITQQPPGGASFTLAADDAANANNPNVDPQKAETSEIGTKWDLLHRRLSLTGALYRTQYSDTIATDTDGTFYHAGEKSVSGIELGVVGQLNPHWNISAGYTVMDTKVKNVAAVTADGSADLAYSPTDAFTLWTTYASKRFTIGGGARYNGEMKRGRDGAVGTPAFVKGYMVFDGVATYQLTQRVQLQLNAYNLLDKQYVAAINKSGYRYTPGTPQTFRLTANISF